MSVNYSVAELINKIRLIFGENSDKKVSRAWPIANGDFLPFVFGGFVNIVPPNFVKFLGKTGHTVFNSRSRYVNSSYMSICLYFIRIMVALSHKILHL